jgi:glycosyltransferase involved in cell wall biosynthesis
MSLGAAVGLYRHGTNLPAILNQILRSKRVLISTIAPISGGVPQMARFIVDQVRSLGLVPIIGYYQPYRITPALSVPSYRLLRGKIGKRQLQMFGGVETHAMGAWLPELEFTHYLSTRLWKELLSTCEYHVSVSGNCLAATPYLSTNKPFWSWVATPWHDDRKDRVRSFSLLRRGLDKFINSPVISRLERTILRTGNIVALSQYTQRTLNKIIDHEAIDEVMPMPVDVHFFVPQNSEKYHRSVGFVGRLDDPRKNIELLIDAIAYCHKNNYLITATLIGGDINHMTRSRIQELGLTEHIKIIEHVERDQLPKYLRTMDAFIIPSHQEGLCIAGLEAMSCGVPVISTKCGGPEEFVIHGKTGLLVDSNIEAVGAALLDILTNNTLHKCLSEQARILVETRYTIETAKQIFTDSFKNTFH